MKNQSTLKLNSLVGYMVAMCFLISSCSKNEASNSGQSKDNVGTLKKGNLRATNLNSDTTYNLLFNVDYETGTMSSGIANLDSTRDTAPDAAYMISPGRSGNYAIAHKVVLGDSSYFSDSHWRSESATAYIPVTQFVPGQERRYEFSALLKNWTPYTTGMPTDGDIFFQAKLGGGGEPAWYFMTKRNGIDFRAPNANLETTIVSDYRPYINQWMDFRVDVLWASTATGYIKVYSKLPGQTSYTLIWQISNFQTWNPLNPNATNGYLKWGLYRPDASVANGDVTTRIVYHDDIRMYQIQP